ncbi:hypothetical protein ECPA14_1367, partial [Escherichia coli PA14]
MRHKSVFCVVYCFYL